MSSAIVSLNDNCFVYVIRCVGGRFYVGSSTDVVWRLCQHKCGLGCRFVSRFGFVSVDSVLCVCSFSDVLRCDKLRFAERLLSEVYRVKYGFYNVGGYCWSQSRVRD